MGQGKDRDVNTGPGKIWTTGDWTALSTEWQRWKPYQSERRANETWGRWDDKHRQRWQRFRERRAGKWPLWEKDSSNGWFSMTFPHGVIVTDGGRKSGVAEDKERIPSIKSWGRYKGMRYKAWVKASLRKEPFHLNRNKRQSVRIQMQVDWLIEKQEEELLFF